MGHGMLSATLTVVCRTFLQIYAFNRTKIVPVCMRNATEACVTAKESYFMRYRFSRMPYRFANPNPSQQPRSSKYTSPTSTSELVLNNLFQQLLTQTETYCCDNGYVQDDLSMIMVLTFRPGFIHASYSGYSLSYTCAQSIKLGSSINCVLHLNIYVTRLRAVACTVLARLLRRWLYVT